MSQANPLPDKYEVEIFFIEGFSPKFYNVLRKFCRYVYRTHNGFSDYQTFEVAAIARVEDRLSQGKYDPEKSTLSWYIYRLIWNQNSYENYHRKRIRYLEDNPEYSNNAELFRVSESRESFFLLCHKLGVRLNYKKFVQNLSQEIKSPIVLAYLWLVKGGKFDRENVVG
jgi:hypothetical protein